MRQWTKINYRPTELLLNLHLERLSLTKAIHLHPRQCDHRGHLYVKEGCPQVLLGQTQGVVLHQVGEENSLCTRPYPTRPGVFRGHS